MITDIGKCKRQFTVGNKNINITDCGKILLDENEQVTFVSEKNSQYDVLRKSWGYYATPSLNGRLKTFGLNCVLTKNINTEKYYILLVEDNEINEFERYCIQENLVIITWLNTDKNLQDIDYLSVSNNLMLNLKCPICESYDTVKKHSFTKKPNLETDFNVENYYREIWYCNNCGHFYSETDFDLKSIYEGNYAKNTYGSQHQIYEKYRRIVSLDNSKSDNYGRVQYILKYVKDRIKNNYQILDIGAGLGVFLSKIKKLTNWVCTGIETDIKFVNHLRNKLNINTIEDNILSCELDMKYDIICLIKVLEHLENPIKVLKKCRKYLKTDGFFYIELPDGECAVTDNKGYEREEFYIEHYHIYSMNSLEMMLRKSQLKSVKLERLIEPSGKYTFRAIVKKY
tara:strand:+ start:109 stop:1305 length:1197 start_codon:yes stop_codon:yes gene_type:complete